VLVVEHDEDAIRTADWIVDMGPRAGEHGGEVIVAGDLDTLMACEQSLTADYLSGRKAIAVPKRREVGAEHPMLGVKGATEHNLKGVTALFTQSCLSCVTGVSGSGKSTMTNDTLYRALHST